LATDPRIAKDARRLNRIAFEEMLELASLGAKVLQTRSVELAMNNNLPIRVLTSMAEVGDDNPGTLVCHEDETMEERVVRIGMRSHTGVAQTMFEALAERNINVKVIATSEIKISVLIDAEYTELAVRALHSAFELDKATKPAVSAP